jgi:glycosyltransferase involved in cell wall biosynthesis
VNAPPTVSIVIPTFNEARFLRATLESVDAQTYGAIVEVIVADGRSTDATRAIAADFERVRVVDNPDRIQAAGLNRAIEACRGDVVVRVDGHCVLEPDYVERCVDALLGSGAAIVGGAMSPVGVGRRQRGIACAMRSRLGAGPARFHVGGAPGWVDTVYLGAFRRDDALAVGGYAEDMVANEDAEFAIRMSARGGVWFEPSIRSSYAPREGFVALVRQFYRYGRSRATTARRHPSSVKMRQLAAPALVLAVFSPHRKQWLAVYAAVVAGRSALELRRDAATAATFALALPAMHFAWGTGFLVGLASPEHAPATAVDLPEE